jgi:hypothetical protein
MIFGQVYDGPWTLKFGQIFSCHHSFLLKKVMTTKYLAKFQSPMAVSWPKIIQLE